MTAPTWPEHVMVPVVGIAIDIPGALTCDDCGNTFPTAENACTHGHHICLDDWPSWCRECANELEDDRAAEIAHDMAQEDA